MADNTLRIPRKLKTETHKQLKIRTDMNSICVCSSMFTNTSSWAKELRTIALPTFKNSLLKNSFAPLFGIKFKEILFLLQYGSIYCPFSQGYNDIWTRVCLETIVTFFSYCCTVLKNIPDK